MADQVTSTDLIIKLPAVMTAETFTDDKEFEKLFAKVQEEVAKHTPDVSTATGRQAIASLAYKVARTKTALVGQGKKLTEAWRDQTKKVNSACNTIEERLDQLKSTVRKPLDDWETAEAARVDGHKFNLQCMINHSKLGMGRSSAELRELLADIEQHPSGPQHCEEFAPQFSVAKQDAIDHVNRLLTATEKQEADAAELEELRAAKAEADRKENERVAAEQKKQLQIDYAKRVIQHIKQCGLGMIGGQTYPYAILFHELEKKVIIDDSLGDWAGEAEEARQEALSRLREAQQADRERADAARKDEDRKLAEEASRRAEQVASDRIATAEKAAQDAKEQAERDIVEAAELAEQNAAAERQRIADAQEAEAAEQLRRDKNRAHRKSINTVIVAELIKCAGVTAEQAQKIVTHLALGNIPNVTLKY